MQTDLALLLMVLVVVLVLGTIVLCRFAVRRLGRVRGAVRDLTDRLDRAEPALKDRLTGSRLRAINAVEASVVLTTRLQGAENTMAGLSRRLREGRGSIDEATRERLLPLARWFGRVMAIGRLWRMQRDMWRG